VLLSITEQLVLDWCNYIAVSHAEGNC